jgi:hypothetical protein
MNLKYVLCDSANLIDCVSVYCKSVVAKLIILHKVRCCFSFHEKTSKSKGNVHVKSW